MHRQLISFITAIAFTACVTPVSFAQDFRFAGNDPFANRNSAHVGLYLKIPFSGGLKNLKKDKINFGAALGFRQNYSSRYNANFNANMNMLDMPRTRTLNVLDLKFNEHGFKTVSFAGHDLRGLKVGDVVMLKDDEGGVKWGKVALYTVGGVLVLVGLATLAVVAFVPLSD